MDLKKAQVSNFSIEADIEFLSPYFDENIYNIFPLSKFNKNSFLEKDFKKNNPTLYLDELNSLNYRSQEFKNKHDGLHILFSGCSNTFGIGLSYDETWSYKTYKKILENNTVSGYYNLSVPGNSFFHCIVDIFKYVKNFGNPDFIFINFPSLNRFYSYDKKNTNFLPAFYKEQSIDILCLLGFQYYLMLEQYCNANNIKLFSFSWAQNQKNILNEYFKIAKLNNFNTWFSINNINLENFLNIFYENNKKLKFSKYARDNAHYGLAYHEYWSNFMYNKMIGK